LEDIALAIDRSDSELPNAAGVWKLHDPTAAAAAALVSPELAVLQNVVFTTGAMPAELTKLGGSLQSMNGEAAPTGGSANEYTPAGISMVQPAGEPSERRSRSLPHRNNDADSHRSATPATELSPLVQNITTLSDGTAPRQFPRHPPKAVAMPTLKEKTHIQCDAPERRPRPAVLTPVVTARLPRDSSEQADNFSPPSVERISSPQATFAPQTTFAPQSEFTSQIDETDVMAASPSQVDITTGDIWQAAPVPPETIYRTDGKAHQQI
jgi:hypothetical protein